VGTASPRSSDAHLFDLGICGSAPTEVLQGDGGQAAQAQRGAAALAPGSRRLLMRTQPA